MRRPLCLSLILISLALTTACRNSSTANTTNYENSPFKSSNSNSPFKPSTPTAQLVPTPLNHPGDEVRLHVDNVKKVPVAKRPEDFYELDDAISGNDDAKALLMIRGGKVSMVENDTSVTVIEPTLYLTKVRVKSSGVVGWVKSAWLY